MCLCVLSYACVDVCCRVCVFVCVSLGLYMKYVRLLFTSAIHLSPLLLSALISHSLPLTVCFNSHTSQGSGSLFPLGLSSHHGICSSVSLLDGCPSVLTDRSIRAY